MSRAYEIHIRWRGYRWTLRAIATSSSALVSGMLDYFQGECRVSVKQIQLREPVRKAA